MQRPDDPPLVSPDGRYSFGTETWERRNNEWLEAAYVYNEERKFCVLTLDRSLLADIEWGEPGHFTLIVWHPSAPDVRARVSVHAVEGQFEIEGEATTQPLRVLDNRLEAWLEAHLPPRPQTPAPASAPSKPPKPRRERFIEDKRLDALAALGICLAVALALVIAVNWP
ncbi:MAG: hypothetical protein AAF127_04835 [Pseudomonadota bacterium]